MMDWACKKSSIDQLINQSISCIKVVIKIKYFLCHSRAINNNDGSDSYRLTVARNFKYNTGETRNLIQTLSMMLRLQSIGNFLTSLFDKLS